MDVGEFEKPANQRQASSELTNEKHAHRNQLRPAAWKEWSSLAICQSKRQQLLGSVQIQVNKCSSVLQCSSSVPVLLLRCLHHGQQEVQGQRHLEVRPSVADQDAAYQVGNFS